MFDRSGSNHIIRAAGFVQAAGGGGFDPGEPSKGIAWDPVTSEIIFDGFGFLVAPNSADFVFTGDFMVELPAVVFDVNNIDQHLYDFYQTTGDQRSCMLVYQGSLATPKLSLFLATVGTGVALTINPDWTPTVATAYDIAFNRIGDACRLFAGASGGLLPMIGSGTLSGALHASTVHLTIGGPDTLDPALAFKGRMKSVPRITNGSGRGGDDNGYTFPATIWPTA